MTSRYTDQINSKLVEIPFNFLIKEINLDTENYHNNVVNKKISEKSENNQGNKLNLEKNQNIFMKFSPIPKPDFSSIEQKENNLNFLNLGSCKKKKYFPNSPIKTTSLNNSTSTKINLFNNMSNVSCKKLNFTENSENIITKEKLKNFNDNKSKMDNIFNNLKISGNPFNINFDNFNKNNIENSPANNLDNDTEMYYSNEKFDEIENNLEKTNYTNNPFEIESIEGKDFSKFKKNKIINSIKSENIKNYLNNSNEISPITESSKNECINHNNINVSKFSLYDENNKDNSNLKEFKEDNLINNNKNNHKNFFEKVFKYEKIISEINEYAEKTIKMNFVKFYDGFIILKPLASGSFGIVYKCQNKSNGKIYAIKQTKTLIGKYEFLNIKNLISEINYLPDSHIFSSNLVKYFETWEEQGLMYIKQEYCNFGDLLDFLLILEKKNFNFNLEFYWDIIFEMISGVKYFHDIGYLHLDIKPVNFLISKEGCVKLGDFNLSRKKNYKYEDYFEGDSVYLAPEILEVKKFNEITEKSDIFSLGLSILEIVGKIKLPQNGLLWHQIRSENFKIPEEFFVNSNLKKIPGKIFDLINEMICFNVNERKDLLYFLENFFELKKRFENLINKKYKRSYENFLTQIISEDDLEINIIAKRSNSYKLCEDLKKY